MRPPEQVTKSHYKMAIQQQTSNKPAYNIPPNSTINQHTSYLYSTTEIGYYTTSQYGYLKNYQWLERDK